MPEPKERRILRDKALNPKTGHMEPYTGGGRLECDGTWHFWVCPNWQGTTCQPETEVGPCDCPK